MVFDSIKRRLQKHTSDNESETSNSSITNNSSPDSRLESSSTDSSVQSSSHQFNPSSKTDDNGTTDSSDPSSTQPTMRAIAITSHGGLETLTSTTMPKPPSPTGHDLLIRIHGSSIDTIDTQIRSGTQDSSSSTPQFPRILGYDASGTIEALGDLAVANANGPQLQVGDAVFYTSDPRRQGSNAQFQLVDARTVGPKPASLDFVEAASMPLSWITAWVALLERLEIREPKPSKANSTNTNPNESDSKSKLKLEPENAGILIINGATGTGSLASQLARHILHLPIVISTASIAASPATSKFCREMGATHVVDHQEDIPAQIEEMRDSGELDPDVPIRYVLVVGTAERNLERDLEFAAEVVAPFGKVCGIVQMGETARKGGSKVRGQKGGAKDGGGEGGGGDVVAGICGTRWMAKSLTFVWEMIGTKAAYGVDLESRGRILGRLKELVDDGTVRCHMNHQLPATLEGIRKAHEMQESGFTIGKIGIGRDGSKGAPGFEDSMF